MQTVYQSIADRGVTYVGNIVRSSNYATILYIIEIISTLSSHDARSLRIGKTDAPLRGGESDDLFDVTLLLDEIEYTRDPLVGNASIL